MPSRPKISAAEFVQDLRSGLTACELMDKYSLVARELDGVLDQLKKTLGAPAEIYGRTAKNRTHEKTDKIRFLRRHRIDLPVLIYDANNPTIRGEVRDISEKGIGVQKMDIKAPDIKSLVVLANEYFSIDPFGFEAQCRWTSPTTDDRHPLAGFEIVKISEESLKSLGKFIETYANACSVPKAKSVAALSEARVFAATGNGAIWVCPFCEMPQPQEFEECPQCGILVAKYLLRLEATRNKVAEIMEKQPVVKTAAIPKQNSINKATIAVPAQVWKQLEALGGDPHDHLNSALSTYLLRARVSGMDRKDRLSGP
jgi:hypothetical protein